MIFIVAAVLVVVIYAVRVYYVNHRETLPEFKLRKNNQEYTYRLREQIMTKKEEHFFEILHDTFHKKFYIIPKMDLSVFLDHEIEGQNWKAARANLQDKTVDFMLVHKKLLVPICAIEVMDRLERDEITEVRTRATEKILDEVGFPLVKLKRPDKMTKKEIVEKFAKVMQEYYEA